MPQLRIVSVPAKTYYLARSAESEMKDVAAGAIDAIIDALTRTLTPEEAKGRPAVAEKVEETLRFTGKTYEEALEAVNEGFLARHWADGLAVVPPTKEAVKRMLTGTSRSPDEVIGVPFAPKGGKATIEKIAINAVMAGAKPEYLPVIIAAMEVLGDKNYYLLHLQASASSIAPVILVNGPIATELGINSGIGFLGHGHRPNNTIGRAVRLCLINFGHTWPGVNDMAQLGRSAAFGNWTFAEAEKENPWEPYHVELGFKPEDSTVTVCSSNYFKTGPGGQVLAQSVFEQFALLARVIEVTEFPHTFSVRGGATVVLGMNPVLAQGLAKMGLTKKDVKQWLYEHARVPYTELTVQDKDNIKKLIKEKKLPYQYWIEENANIHGKILSIPVVDSPEKIRIVVVGQPGGLTMVWRYDIDQDNRGHGTKLIRGATLTKTGR